MQDYRRLKVWHAAHQLVLDLYTLTRGFPKEELYGLISQIRRAASSIPANLAEGCGLGSDRAFGRHVQIAQGSASELDYELQLARDLGYLAVEEHDRVSAMLASVRRMLGALQKRLADHGSRRTAAVSDDRRSTGLLGQ